MTHATFSAQKKQTTVIPAKAGIQRFYAHWIPAFAGMTSAIGVAEVSPAASQLSTWHVCGDLSDKAPP
ncbi:MAG: hypothetical protein JWN23_2399 [Rhodocyclales bacterium]|nr:hypothetical protein [Rhodocyclales bacterium]